MTPIPPISNHHLPAATADATAAAPSQSAARLPNLYYPDEDTLRALADGVASIEDIEQARDNWMAKNEKEVQMIAKMYFVVKARGKGYIDDPETCRGIPRICEAIEDLHYFKLVALLLCGVNIHQCGIGFKSLSYAVRVFTKDPRFLKLLIREGAQLVSGLLYESILDHCDSLDAFQVLLDAYPQEVIKNTKAGISLDMGVALNPEYLEVLFEYGLDPEATNRIYSPSQERLINSTTLIEYIISITNNPKKIYPEKLKRYRKYYAITTDAIRKKIKKEHEAELIGLAFSLRKRGFLDELIKLVADQYLAPFYEGRLPPPWPDDLVAPPV